MLEYVVLAVKVIFKGDVPVKMISGKVEESTATRSKSF